jgi:hypothetical protein
VEIEGISITTSRGVPQRPSSSPILFDIYVEDILKELQRRNHFSRMFADDLACIAENKIEATKIIELVK